MPNATVEAGVVVFLAVVSVGALCLWGRSYNLPSEGATSAIRRLVHGVCFVAGALFLFALAIWWLVIRPMAET